MRTYYHLVRLPHHCEQPGPEERRKDDVGLGTIWQCDHCKKFYELQVLYSHWQWVEIEAKYARSLKRIREGSSQ